MLRLNIHPSSKQLAIEKLAQPLITWGFAALSLLLVLGGYLLFHFKNMNGRLLDVNKTLLQHKTMLNHLGEGVYCMGAEGQTVFINPAAINMLGYTAGEALTCNSHELFHHSRPDGGHYPVEECPAYLTLHDGKYRQIEETFIRKDGTFFPVEMTATPIAVNDSIESVVVVFSDISDRKQAEEKITQLAFYDPLTQLPNRRLLLDRIERALAESSRHTQYGAVVMIDLDHFKEINDTEGHDAGDSVLQDTASRLLKTLRETDTVGRLGGDEFMVLLSGLGEDWVAAKDHAIQVSEDILENLRPAHEIGGKAYFTTPSIGIALFKNYNDSINQLMKEADLAMYRAKDGGRDRYELFDNTRPPT